VESFDDPRITLIRQANAGPGAARNTGILPGKADWIVS
jgi:glycosyltransferase involved in cell wall biosynthesis